MKQVDSVASKSEAPPSPAPDFSSVLLARECITPNPFPVQQSRLIYDDLPIYNSPEAAVTRDQQGSVTLRPPYGQVPLRDYPGGLSNAQDVKQTQELVDRLPGNAGLMTQAAFQLYKTNYNSRLGENFLPTALKVTEAPTNAQLAPHWKLHYDVDLYATERYGRFGVRDLRPRTETFPGSNKQPGSFFAVALDSELKPVDVLQYQSNGRYQGQYQFIYERLDDGRRRVNVRHWLDTQDNRNSMVGPTAIIGDHSNTLAGVSQFYYDQVGHCTEALYYPGYAFLRDRSQWQPMVDMKFPQGRVSGTPEERSAAARIDYFDLLGPRLPSKVIYADRIEKYS